MHNKPHATLRKLSSLNREQGGRPECPQWTAGYKTWIWPPRGLAADGYVRTAHCGTFATAQYAVHDDWATTCSMPHLVAASCVLGLLKETQKTPGNSTPGKEAPSYSHFNQRRRTSASWSFFLDAARRSRNTLVVGRSNMLPPDLGDAESRVACAHRDAFLALGPDQPVPAKIFQHRV